MATCSMIGIKNEDGSIDAVYCHWDGYPSNNGAILSENYEVTEKVTALLEHGDISSLGETLEECVFYARDCGEEISMPCAYTSIENLVNQRSSCQYFYVFSPSLEGWTCFTDRLDRIDLENIKE